MSQCVINNEGLLYGGFCEGKPLWYRTKREECLLDDKMAAMVVKQMTELGTPCVQRDSMSIARKWVPADLAATLDFSAPT